jgi:signal transduction histidine kinase
VWWVFGGFDGIDAWLEVNPEALEKLYQPVIDGPWVTLIFLSFCAAFLLPRQFHMIFTENLSPESLNTASWLFPLYLLLLNLPIVPILWAGNALAIETSPDFFPLGVTLLEGHGWLSLLTFIGGLSAASAMVIVTSLALASMCLNHLVLPASFISSRPQTDLYRWILWGKRVLIGAVIAAGYGFYRVAVHNEGLVQLGLISFVAVAQLLPGMIALLFWPRATQVGFLLGLVGGALVWFGMLIVPLLINSEILADPIDLSSLFAQHGSNIWTAATFWSLATNALLLVVGTVISEPSVEEVEATEACLQQDMKPLAGQVTETSPTQFQRQLTQVMGAKAAKAEVVRALDELGLNMDEDRPTELRLLRERIERNLSGLLGPVLAQLIVDNRLRLRHKSQTALAESIRHMESRLEDSREQLRGAVRALDDLRRYHRDVLHELPIGVCSVAPNGEILIWNYAMCQLSGISGNAAVGRKLTQLTAPWNQLLSEFAESSNQQQFKVQAQIDERPHSYNFHKAELETSLGQIDETSGLVILVEDRSELDTLEAELSHAERLASIGRFAAGVAHEIGNPLTGIDSIAQNMQYEETRDDMLLCARDIRQQAQRIGAIVKSLLAFSHGETLGPNDYETFPLRECIDEAVRLVGLSRAGKQVGMRVYCGSAVQITADKQRLLQVFVNLLSNACDASPPGSDVRVRGYEEENTVVIDVIDEGSGIDEDLQRRIFEPFFTTKKVGEGTGLGLPMAHSIVEDHAGQISLHSRPGEGTVMTVRLPLSPQQNQNNARTA